MIFILPYRVKNPWKHFPVATVSLIGLNVFIYLLTSSENAFFAASENILPYCYQMGETNFFTIFSAMFLHADIFHIGGNMLFLWVFGPPVEDRLGIPRFLAVYLATGVVGFLLQGFVDIIFAGSTMPGLGASGAIMGIMGAYWFVFSWSIVCVAYWILLFWRGVWELKAFWVIGAYIVLDLFEGITSEKGAGGVANFAHVGGGVAGALLCLALKVRRDSEQVSEAKASQAEMKDLKLVSLADLEVMRAAEPQRVDIIRALIPQAVRNMRMDLVKRAFAEAGPTLLTEDPNLVIYYLMRLEGDHKLYKTSQLMRLARHVEHDPDPKNAIGIYDLILDHYPNAPETEMVLYRLALLFWEKQQDKDTAWMLLSQLLERFPYGSLEHPAKQLMAKLK